MTKINDGIKYELKTNARGEPYWCVVEYLRGGKMQTVKIPDKIDEIPVAEIASLAFDGCGICCVEINCEKIRIHFNAFCDCKNLSLITFYELQKIKAEMYAVNRPNLDFVVVALTQHKETLRVDVHTTKVVNKAFRENKAVVLPQPQ
jgi:hypothetical protein